MEKNIFKFDEQVKKKGGYAFLKDHENRFNLQEEHLSRFLMELAPLKGKTVVDIGCGTGENTFSVHKETSFSMGVEPAASAVRLAAMRFLSERLRFAQATAYQLPFRDKAFDVAFLRSVLHHLYRPEEGIKECFRVCKTAVIIEAVGTHPYRMFMERFSKRFKEVEERSFPLAQMRDMIKKSGGRISSWGHVTALPGFFPESVINLLRPLEKWLEANASRAFFAPYIFGGIYFLVETDT